MTGAARRSSTGERQGRRAGGRLRRHRHRRAGVRHREGRLHRPAPVVFVPLAGATVTPDAVRVRHDKKFVQDAPSTTPTANWRPLTNRAYSPTTTSRTCSDQRENAGSHDAERRCRWGTLPRSAGPRTATRPLSANESTADGPGSGTSSGGDRRGCRSDDARTGVRFAAPAASRYRSHHGTAAGRTIRQRWSPLPREMR